MKIKIGDILIISFALIAVISLVFLNKKQGNNAILEVDGKIIETFDLSVDTTYTYNGQFTNKIVIKDGSVYFEDSNCSDKTCVHSGSVSKNGQVICCLPNKVIVTVVGNKEDLDVISG